MIVENCFFEIFVKLFIVCKGVVRFVLFKYGILIYGG